MTFITKGNKLFHAACAAFYYPGWDVSGAYNGIYLSIQAHDYSPLTVPLRCTANIFPPNYPAHCFGAIPSVRCVLIRCVFALTFAGIRFLFPVFVYLSWYYQ